VTPPKIAPGTVALVAMCGAYIALQIFSAGIEYERQRTRKVAPDFSSIDRALNDRDDAQVAVQ